MPKKTAYSRGGAQRNKTKQKSFELVRPASDENVLETIESSEGEEREEDAVGVTSSVSEEGDAKEEEEEVRARSRRSAGAKASAPLATAAAVASAPAEEAPRSAAARLAARRHAAQRAQRSSSSLISVEHYNYVRKDLIFILILAIIMFGAIIILHFVLGS
jgi:hypothetical protein